MKVYELIHRTMAISLSIFINLEFESDATLAPRNCQGQRRQASRGESGRRPLDSSELSSGTK